MALRTRLSLFFVLIVLVPLAGAIIAVATFVPRELDNRTVERLRGAAAGATTLRDERLDRAARDVSRIARGLAGAPHAALKARLDAARLESGLDFLAIGSLSSMRESKFAPGIDVAAIVSSPVASGVERASAQIPGRGILHGGWFTDQVYARRLARETGVDVAVFDGRRLIASSSAWAAGAALGSQVAGPFTTNGARGLVMNAGRDGGSLVLMTRPAGGIGHVTSVLALIGIAGLLLAGALGVAIARAMARPLAELAEGAIAMAAGDLTVRVHARGRDEVAKVAAAFNTMAAGVQSYVDELRGSRDELRRALGRLGATLSSTRGMDEMVGAVLEAAAATLGARAGAVYLLGPDGELVVESSFGFEAAQTTREAAAVAADRAMPVLLPGLGADDPLGRTAAAAPLYRDVTVVGAIALASAGIEPFGQQELATLSSFAAQASIAIDNVFLREEAERMARTDPLTQIPNRRMLEQVLARELERSRRYGTVASVVMIDLDHFKAVNDTHGHLAGDHVLVEAVRRIGAVVRHGVDVLARYGGEEFVLVLPETPPAGAAVVAEKVREAMAATPFPVAGGISVTASAGVAVSVGGGATPDELLHTADCALYEAKQQGRNRVVVSESVSQGVGT